VGDPMPHRYRGGMTYAGDSSIDARVRAVETDFNARQTKLFIRFALIEGAVLLLLAVLIFGFEIIDPDIGVWFLVGVAVIGGFLMSMLLLRLVQARTQAIAQAKGENPLF
jgi:RsiW-degrading membrane proteinase PrsW (M82 family)